MIMQILVEIRLVIGLSILENSFAMHSIFLYGEGSHVEVIFKNKYISWLLILTNLQPKLKKNNFMTTSTTFM